MTRNLARLFIWEGGEESIIFSQDGEQSYVQSNDMKLDKGVWERGEEFVNDMNDGERSDDKQWRRKRGGREEEERGRRRGGKDVTISDHRTIS